MNVALCSDASATRLDFISEDYVRWEIRGQSTCFECLDQRDVVLQTTTSNKSTRAVSFVLLPFSSL